MNQRRLLIVVNTARMLLTHRLPLALEAQRRGYDVHIATPESPDSARIIAAGLTWHALPLSRSALNPVSELATIVRFIRLYRRLRPDLVHHVTPKPVLYGTIAARIARVPAVVNAITGMGHVYSSEGGGTLLRRLVTWLFWLVLRHRNMRVIFQNVEQQAIFVDNHIIPPSRAVLIRGAGVDTDVFQPARSDEPRADVPAVAMVSRMIATKGVGEFVEAARALRADGIRARFILLGEPDPGNPASVPETQLRAWAGERVVEYWGLRDDMPRILQQIDVVCLPSYYSEGVPKALIEAAAVGIPIVTTDHPGCRDIVRHEENGLLVPTRDVPALAMALRRMIEEPGLRERLGAVGRARVINDFSLDRVLAQTISVYDALVA